MKKTLILLMTFCVGLVSNVYSQTITEPDFAGEVFAVKQDNNVVNLEKNTVQIKTNAGASVYLTGIGKIRSRIAISGCCSKVRFSASEPVQFIVKAVDNKTDPISIISFFTLDNGNKKERRAELASASTFFGGVSENNLKYLDYSAKKYGESSYLITLKEQPIGEIGVTVKNPNNRDEKNLIVSTFAFD